MLLVGILAAFTVPRFADSDAFAARRAADEMLTALRYAQQLAMARGGSIRFVSTANSYRVETSAGSVLPNPQGGGYAVALPGGVSASAVTITFDALGRPSVAPTIAVGGHQIRVEAETGYARLTG